MSSQSSRELQKLLGVGGFGIVFKAVNSAGIETAVKYIFPVNRKQFRECTVTKKLKKHDNVVTIIAVKQTWLDRTELDKIFLGPPFAIQNETAKQLWNSFENRKNQKIFRKICIQQELCGENLRAWLNSVNKDQISEQDVQTTIVTNIITGLKYLHDNKIIHRDLNPNNVMFSAVNFQLPVKIGDFGLSRVLHSETSQTRDTLTTSLGTLCYRAPEISCKDYSYQADLYSLGLIIWEVAQLITTRNERALLFHKYLDLNNEDVIHNHVKMPGMKELILHLTRTEVKDRVQNIDQVVKIMESWGTKSLKVTNPVDLGLYSRHIISDNDREILVEKGFSSGAVSLKKNKVLIAGQEGREPRIEGGASSRATFRIEGGHCKIFALHIRASDGKIGIQLIGSDNMISKVQFTGGKCCLEVCGDTNKLEYLNISDAETGIEIGGCSNVLDYVYFVKIRRCGIYISEKCTNNRKCTQNTISNVGGDRCKIEDYGINNSVDYQYYHKIVELRKWRSFEFL